MNESENNESPLSPLLTEAHFRRRILQLIGFATERSLSVLLVDGEGMQLPVLVTIDELPASPEPEILLRVVSDLGEQIIRIDSRGGLAFVLERPGESQPHAFDELWADAVFSAGAGAAADVRILGVFLLHSKGVRRLKVPALRSL